MKGIMKPFWRKKKTEEQVVCKDGVCAVAPVEGQDLYIFCSDTCSTCDQLKTAVKTKAVQTALSKISWAIIDVYKDNRWREWVVGMKNPKLPLVFLVGDGKVKKTSGISTAKQLLAFLGQ